MMNDRAGIPTILVLPSSQSSQLLDHLCDLRFASQPLNLLLANTAADAENLILKHRARVGVLVVSPDCPESHDDAMAYLLSRTALVGWIAALVPGALAEPGITRLVTQFCADFLHLPLTREGLAEAVLVAEAAAAAQTLTIHRRFAERPIIGLSPVMHKLGRNLLKIAPVDAPVLITGESGTGKELVARAIHYYSPRANAPFVAVDCGSLPDSLIQSKLFGHEKGAFTGATEKKKGLIESADGGTLFLDKIENLPLPQQVNLLRFLQESTIDPVGSNRSISVNARVIAAAPQDIEAAVASHSLREDLFYRLNVLAIQLPALRARGKDIELLAYHYLHQCHSKVIKDFSPTAIEALKSYAWPGNVRELVNRIRRAAVMCESAYIQVGDLGFGLLPRYSESPIMTLTEARAKAEREIVLQSLKCTGYNISAAARLLKISRLSLYRLIEKYCLVRKETS